MRALVESDEVADWQGNGRQIDFVQQLADAGTITSTNLADLFSALDPKWRAKLGWTKITLPLTEAVAFREAVRALFENGEVADWQGNGRQIDFVQQLADAGTITSTNLGHLFGALDPEWRAELGWGIIHLPLEQAVAIRAAVSSLFENGSVAAWRGNGRQIDFVQQLRENRTITSTNLGHFFAALDAEWRADLGWTMIGMPLEQAVAFRAAVWALFENGEVAAWQGNGRQIEFIQQLADAGTITSTNLGALFTALDPEWRTELGWSQMNMPLKQAVAFRAAVWALFENGEVADWQGNGRQIDFVQQLADAGTITSTHLGALIAALDAEWRTELGWSKINLPLKEA
ncbi:MAG: hypothetical protein E5W94_31455, partial [Mesorhizobium sp.]